MQRVKFNKLIDSLSGRVGDMIFYEAGGQNITVLTSSRGD